uniref:Uncharacterized protein n=1 Tax=Aplanochytrium stocchinoi TaxID=215587 RepID=A0A7S3LMA0_9STRA
MNCQIIIFFFIYIHKLHIYIYIMPKATLMKLCSDIKTVVNILNLAITTAKMKIGVFDPSSDLSKSVESEKIARDVKFRLDCGRLSEVKLATGEVYEFVQTPVKRKPGQKTKDLVNKGYANVWVTQTEISKYILTLKFSHENLEDHDDDKVDSVDVNFLLPSKSFKLRKQRKKDLENGILCNSDTDQFDLCYSLVQNKRICYLIFESPGALSAQTFEEFILLLQGDHVKNSEEDVDKLSNLMDKVGFETPQKD